MVFRRRVVVSHPAVQLPPDFRRFVIIIIISATIIFLRRCHVCTIVQFPLAGGRGLWIIGVVALIIGLFPAN